MPNTLSFYVDSIASDRETAVLKESTVAEFAPPARQEFNMYVKAYKMNADAEETEIVITPDDEPDYVAEWVVGLTVDGWYRFSSAAVKDFDAAETYNQYDCVYDEGVDGFGVYRMTSTNSVSGSAWSPENTPGIWEYIADPARLAYNVGEDNESLNVDCAIYDVILSPNTEYEYASYLASLGKEVCSVDCSLENLEMIIRLATIIDGMTVRNDRSEMPAGERLARRAQTITSQLNG